MNEVTDFTDVKKKKRLKPAQAILSGTAVQ